MLEGERPPKGKSERRIDRVYFSRRALQDFNIICTPPAQHCTLHTELLELLAQTGAVLRSEPKSNQAKADAVKEAFQHAWNGYMKYAFPHDELTPVSNGHADSR